MTRVFPRDIRAAKVCFQGARPWFKARGVEWSEVVERGVPAEFLEETGDEIALRVARVARARAEAESN